MKRFGTLFALLLAVAGMASAQSLSHHYTDTATVDCSGDLQNSNPAGAFRCETIPGGVAAQIVGDAGAMSALDAGGLATDVELAAAGAADADTTADSFASAGGTVANAGTDDALDIDIVPGAAGVAIAGVASPLATDAEVSAAIAASNAADGDTDATNELGGLTVAADGTIAYSPTGNAAQAAVDLATQTELDAVNTAATGGVQTVSNGLTLTGTDAALGGTLNQATTINRDGFALNILSDSGSVMIQSGADTGQNVDMRVGPTSGRIIADDSSAVERGRVDVRDTGVRLRYRNASGVNRGEVLADTTGVTITAGAGDNFAAVYPFGTSFNVSAANVALLFNGVSLDNGTYMAESTGAIANQTGTAANLYLSKNDAAGYPGFGVNPDADRYITMRTSTGGTSALEGLIVRDGAGGVLYTSVSDERAKENIRSANEVCEVFNSINWVEYQIRGNKTRQVGVLAHELQKLLPIAVTGQPGQVRERENNGNGEAAPVYQTVDYSRLIPIIGACAQQRLSSIEARLAALESQ